MKKCSQSGKSKDSLEVSTYVQSQPHSLVNTVTPGFAGLCEPVAFVVGRLSYTEEVPML